MSGTKVDRNELIYLLWCALQGKKPEAGMISPEHGSILLKSCIEHSVSALAADTACGCGFSDEIKLRFSEEKLNAMRINILMLSEAGQIMELLEEKKIPHMPLKGYELIHYYPGEMLRQMGDIDILTGEKAAREIYDMMLERGYTTESYDMKHDDAYTRPPFYKFEMHRVLFSRREKLWHDYYENIFDRLIAEKGQQYRYRFSDEDFYIYLMLHTIKHLRIAGTGIRCLTDIYCFLKKAAPDMEYIERELEALGAGQEEKMLRELAMKLFSLESGGRPLHLTEDQDRLLNALISCGVYGSSENAYKNRIKERSGGKYDKKTKLKYIAGRIFCIPEVYKFRCPKLYRHRLTRPLIFFVRVFNGLTKKRKRVINEFRIVGSAHNEEKG